MAHLGRLSLMYCYGLRNIFALLNNPREHFGVHLKTVINHSNVLWSSRFKDIH